LPSSEPKLRKNAFFIDQSAFSNFPLYVIMPTNDSRVDITFSRQRLTEAERERERQRARINRQRSSQEDPAKESGPGLEKGGEIIPNNAVKQSERGLEKGGEIPEDSRIPCKMCSRT
jgi:hypothetical protein